jgi:AcrR family transcriptional regulator
MQQELAFGAVLARGALVRYGAGMTAVATLPTGRRERLRAEAVQQIKAAGMEQLRAEGPAGLSLRAVARAVGMSSPGVYRYYTSRDELLTALITDVYDDLAQALERARDAAGASLSDRLRAVCLAYYDWSASHPAEFSLVFGAPVPSYSAPPDGSTTAAAQRFGAVFTGLLTEAWPGHADLVQRPPLVPLREAAVLMVGDVALPDDPRFLGTITRLWSRLHGVLTLGLYGHLLPQVVAPTGVRTLYEAEVEDALLTLGLA